MISILCPSRGRPDRFRAMLDSLYATCANPYGIEVVARLDHDDPTTPQYPKPDGEYLSYIMRARTKFRGVLWNDCYAHARGDIVMHAGDDQIFRTPAWDAMIEDAYLRCPDRILMVHGSDDGQHFEKFGAILCLSRRWVDTVGYVTPPQLVGDGCDDWLNELANTLGRRLYLPFVTEHVHPLFGKAPIDRTHSERREDEQAFPLGDVYRNLGEQRAQDVAKLRAAMDPTWTMPGLRSAHG